MKRRHVSVFGGVATAALLATSAQFPAGAAPTPGAGDDSLVSGPVHAAPKSDDRPDPLAAERREQKAEAVRQVVTGNAEVQQRGGSKAVKVAPGQWVEYGTQSSDKLLSFLVEFGNQQDERAGKTGNWDGVASTPDTVFPAGVTGPAKGQIPEPDRSKDNSTYWTSSFDRKHFMDMFFNGMPDQNGESFQQVYKEMSSGRYEVTGDVSEWVQVPNSTSSYGYTESHVDMTRFIDDTAEAWYAQQKAAGKTDEQISAYLKTFDQWDRYDANGNGNFNEPDGYIDHFQAIHAGEGEEAGAPEEDIWSHRWAVNQNGFYKDGIGPKNHPKLGGIKIGNTDFWIRDYTTEPENGGLGVFAHEYGHDLGLPDFYDTKGGENSTAFWTLMSSGSWLNHGGEAIGTTPNHMGPWEKLFLNWLDYETVEAGQSEEVKLGPSHHATKRAQAALVKLPTAFGNVKSPIASGVQGSKYFFSGTNDAKVTSVTSPAFTVPAGGTLSAQVNYDTEKSFDYSYVDVSVDGGSFTSIQTSLSDPDDPNAVNEGGGISGKSNGWKGLTADLSAYAGQSVKVRFRQTNDENTHGFGFAVDAISVGDALVENVEDDAPDWTSNGFYVVTGDSYPVEYEHFYLAENRQYGGNDATLKQGPYNFGWAASKPDWVERFPYQDGMLVWYVNGFQSDNNTSQHPGAGEALPVDARGGTLRWSDGTAARNRIQAFDATFGLEKTDPLSLHREVAKDGQVTMTTLNVPSQPAIPTFDDSKWKSYYDAQGNPGGSVKVPDTGTKIQVLNSNVRNGQMTVQVN
ncbi:MAG TPA: immune inhibitor A domain-containing protein [Nocardioides sp.]|uniref:immune inhibitor A domain-containing protein n=1 Tax=Nocardioides sp. TaxID=35761 RepID=UPI002D80EA0E|nr:immune inhibitor A domain-containing protein [Nocardioides sp.]HET6651435.1 immune inhibitor A domain-containing protein [Nocardioides sp.]